MDKPWIPLFPWICCSGSNAENVHFFRGIQKKFSTTTTNKPFLRPHQRSLAVKKSYWSYFLSLLWQVNKILESVRKTCPGPFKKSPKVHKFGCFCKILVKNVNWYRGLGVHIRGPHGGKENGSLVDLFWGNVTFFSDFQVEKVMLALGKLMKNDFVLLEIDRGHWNSNFTTF